MCIRDSSSASRIYVSSSHSNVSTEPSGAFNVTVAITKFYKYFYILLSFIIVDMIATKSVVNITVPENIPRNICKV